jgi:hypothetical protein
VDAELLCAGPVFVAIAEGIAEIPTISDEPFCDRTSVTNPAGFTFKYCSGAP